MVELRVGSPAGDRLARSESDSVTKTGKWVSEGEIFYMQDVTDGKSLTPDNTLATVTMNITTDGCP